MSFLKLRGGGPAKKELNNELKKDQLLIITFNVIEDISSRITLDSFSRDGVDRYDDIETDGPGLIARGADPIPLIPVVLVLRALLSNIPLLIIHYSSLESGKYNIQGV